MVASSLSDLRQRLSMYRELSDDGQGNGAGEAQGIYFSNHHPRNEDKLAFLFPGQGSQYPEMLSELAIHFPEVRREFEAADRVLAGRFAVLLAVMCFPRPDSTLKRTGSLGRRSCGLISHSRLWVPLESLCFACWGFWYPSGYGRGTQLWRVCGTVCSRCFPGRDAIPLSEARGRLMLSSSPDEPLGMAAIEADRRARV